jgi:hypothetical protein
MMIAKVDLKVGREVEAEIEIDQQQNPEDVNGDQVPRIESQNLI